MTEDSHYMTAVSASFVITGYLLSAFCIFGAALRAILLMLGSESVSLLQMCARMCKFWTINLRDRCVVDRTCLQPGAQG